VLVHNSLICMALTCIYRFRCTSWRFRHATSTRSRP